MMEPWQGHSICAGVQGEGGQAAGGIAFLVFVGDERDLRGGEGSGDSAGITAALAQPVGRDGREETRQSAEDAMAELRRLQVENAELRRANEILTTASAFFAAGLDPTRC